MNKIAGLVCVVWLCLDISAASAVRTCNVPAELIKFDKALPELAAAVSRGDEIKITTLGSSSTFGTGASSDKAAYPSRLDAELDRRYPGYEFNVINIGKGGLIAEDMLESIDTSILKNPPALVLWQTGTNDAIRSIPIKSFKQILRDGISKLKAASISVVLVDIQFYPGFQRVIKNREYLVAMQSVATELDIPLFRRYDIMRYLIDSGQATDNDLLSADMFHLNDFSYGCLAKFIADALEPDILLGQAKRSALLPDKGKSQ